MRDDAGSGSISSSLLHGLQVRDPAAWRRMAELYTPLIYRWALRAGLQPADAADVVQEVFRVVAARVGGFSREGAGGTFRGWLWRITYHKVGDFFRRRKAGASAAGGSDALDELHQLAAPADSSSSEAAEGLGGLCRRGLAMVRGEFSETTWQAFWRVVVEDEPPETVSQSLAVSINVVYLAKSRVLRRLREVLGDEPSAV